MGQLVVTGVDTRTYYWTLIIYKLTLDEIANLIAEDSTNEEVETVAIEPLSKNPNADADCNSYEFSCAADHLPRCIHQEALQRGSYFELPLRFD